MTEHLRRLNRQIKYMQKEIGTLRYKEIENQKLQNGIHAIRNYLDQVKIFMLRLMQDHVRFEIILDHLGHKVSEEDLRKLHDAVLNKPRHISRRALAILYNL